MSVTQRSEREARRYKPYPAYKESGVAWLGEIPAHWEARRLKRIASIRYGLGEPPRQLADGLPFIRATNLTKGRVVDHEMQFVDPKDVPWNRNPVLRADDIIVVRSDRPHLPVSDGIAALPPEANKANLRWLYLPST